MNTFLKDPQLLNNNDSLGNSSLKQGKKYKKSTNIIKSKNKKNKIKTKTSINGFLIKGFNSLMQNNSSLIEGLTCAPRFSDGSLNEITGTTWNDVSDNYQNIQRVLEEVSGQNIGRYIEPGDRNCDYSGVITGINDKVGRLGTSNIQDSISGMLTDLSSSNTAKQQLSNLKLKNKSYYLKYIFWLVVAVTMGGLVVKRVFRKQN